jgi:DNA-binding CsgD family transcriptional regulator
MTRRHGVCCSTLNQVAWDLGGVHDSAELVDAVLTTLLELLGGEFGGLNQVDLRDRTAVRFRSDLASDIKQALVAHLDDHPVIAHYRLCPNDLEPVRIGDLTCDRDWFSSPVYADVFRPLGVRRQLVVLVRFEGHHGCGYAINRTGSDFSDDTRELAAALQPVLIALHRAAEVDLEVSEARAAARQRVGLTARELRVLTLVASGMTAQAIGHVECISPRTVRKHLEHVYDKLGRHDRLAAVDRARQLGLLVTGPSLRGSTSTGLRKRNVTIS